MTKSKDVGVIQKKDGYWEYRFVIVVNGITINRKRSTDAQGNKLKTKRDAIKAKKMLSCSQKDIKVLYREQMDCYTAFAKWYKSIEYKLVSVSMLSERRKYKKSTIVKRREDRSQRIHPLKNLETTRLLPYLKYLSSRPLKALPCLASSRAIS